MQKNVLLAMVLTIGVFFVWQWVTPHPQAQLRPPPAAAQGTVGSSSAPTEVEPVAPGGRKVSTQYPESPDEKIVTERLDFDVASRGGAVRWADSWACEYHPPGQAVVEGDPGHGTAALESLPGALSMDVVGVSELPDLRRSPWKMSREGDKVRVEFEAGGMLLWRELSLSKEKDHPWHADVVFGVRNVSLAEGTVRTVEIAGPQLPMHPPGDDGILVAHGAAGSDGAAEVELLAPAKIREQLAANPALEKKSPTGRFAWIGARADFYLGALIPVDELPADTAVSFHVPPAPPPWSTASAVLRLPVAMPAQGAERSYRFRFYAGPNQRSLFGDEGSPYHVLQGATVNRSFIVNLGPVSTLLAWLLRQFAAIGMGYGAAVIALTVLVRGALFPLSRKSQISMRLHAQKMQRLKPKLDAVKAKYKDPKKQQEATMKVMREEKVSLVPGGCLLAFAQMPIWIALYNVLQTTFEMRHAKFLWAHDLTKPDQLLHVGFFVEYLNLLPILMMATWLASSMMQPLPPDPEQAQQAKIMRWIPLLFGFFLYSYPAGLCLYMTASALWSIGETQLIKKLWISKLELPPSA